MKKYKFLDVGCKLGSSMHIAEKYGYLKSEGLAIDIKQEYVDKLNNDGIDAMVADAQSLPFTDNSFELVIFSHVLEHMPNEVIGKKALMECLRVSSKTVFLALPFFDEDEYLNSFGLKTFYSDWSGHKNMVHLKKITEEYLFGYEYKLKMVKPIKDSNSIEILPISAPKNSKDYDLKLHGEKPYVEFKKNIWREYQITISKKLN